MARGDESSGAKLKGVRDRGLTCEVKNASRNFYFTPPSGTRAEEAAVLVDLVLLRNDPDVDVKKLNLNTVVKSLGSSLTIDKTIYQEFVEKNPLESLTNEELWVKAQEVYKLLVEKVSGVEGRRREDEADLPPAFEETVNYSPSPAEALQQLSISLEEAQRACKEKDAEIIELKRACKKKDSGKKELKRRLREMKRACRKKDAEIRELRDEVVDKAANVASLTEALNGAKIKVDGQPLASSVAATEELQQGNASPSKDGTPALEDDGEGLLADTDDLMDWHRIASLPGEMQTRDLLWEPMNLDDVLWAL